jgi:hypothetical protein
VNIIGTWKNDTAEDADNKLVDVLQGMENPNPVR